MANNELSIPPAVVGDPSAREIIRGWIANNAFTCSLRTDAWDDIGMWGIALADMARHVANGIHKLKGTPEEESLRQIREVFHSKLQT